LLQQSPVQNVFLSPVSNKVGPSQKILGPTGPTPKFGWRLKTYIFGQCSTKCGAGRWGVAEVLAPPTNILTDLGLLKLRLQVILPEPQYY